MNQNKSPKQRTNQTNQQEDKHELKVKEWVVKVEVEDKKKQIHDIKVSKAYSLLGIFLTIFIVVLTSASLILDGFKYRGFTLEPTIRLGMWTCLLGLVYRLVKK